MRNRVAGIVLIGILAFSAAGHYAAEKMPSKVVFKTRPVKIKPEPVAEKIDPKWQWLKEKKVRLAWIGEGLNDKFPGTEKTKGQVLVDAGFNLVRVTMDVDKKDPSLSPDVTEKLSAEIEESRRLGLPLLVGWQYGTSHEEPYRKYRSPKGVEAKLSCCPLDREYIHRHMGRWAVAAAKAGADGFLLDTEMYGSDEATYPGPCVCDDCFTTYLKEYSKGWKAIYDSVPAADRGAWLSANKVTAHYGRYAAKRIEIQYDEIRRQCHAVNPSFLFGHYHILGDLPGIERGLGTPTLPCLFFSGSEYPTGPMWLSERNMKMIRNEGIPALYLPGLYVLQHSPQALADHALISSLYYDGWWVWYGEALLTSVEADNPEAFREPYGRCKDTAAVDYMERLAAMHNRLEKLLTGMPMERWPQQKQYPATDTAGSVPRRDGTIVIDGSLDDPGWKNAALLDFTRTRFNEKAGPENILKVCWDRQALYAAVRCPIPPGTELNVSERGRDNVNMFMGDGIEIFIDPRKSGVNYAHLIISAFGDVYDSRMSSAIENWNIHGDPDWNTGIETGASRTGSEYILEMRIPFKDLSEAPAAGEKWGANFCRYLPSVQTWSPTYGGFHIPDRFGTLTFSDSPSGNK